MDLYSASSWSTSSALPFPVSQRWSPQANPTVRHQRTLRDHVIRVGVSCDMPVYFPAFAGTKLYCLVSGDRGSRVWTTCLRLLRSSPAAGPRTPRTQVRRPTTKPPRHPKYMHACQNFSAREPPGSAGPPNVNLGPPKISETSRARMLKLKTQLDIVKYSLWVQKILS